MLAECLESIRDQTYRDYEVIVVDNGSTDNSWNLPIFDAANWRLCSLGANSGYSPANNLAIKESHGEYLALVNNDIILAPDWATKMVDAIRAEARAGSAACLILQRNHPDRIDSAGFAYYPCGTVTAWRGCLYHEFESATHKPFGAVASAALYRHTAIDRVGLFHDPYFAYYEDTDLAIRLVLHGYSCVFAHSATALHLGSATGVSRSPFHIFHLRRNVEYLYWVDMVGIMAFQYLLPHLLYECIAFLGALRDGQAITILRAKTSALKNIGWILHERQNLRNSLIASEGLRQAKLRLQASVSPWWKALTVRWAEWSGEASQSDGKMTDRRCET